jgi:hypothetical protein
MSDVLTEDTTNDNFLAEVEVMDLSPIREKVFMVAVGTGAPDKVKFLCSTIHGPFNFTEMVQEVGEMWTNHQHHAKVIVPSKDSSKPVEILDENTIDYIECHYADIITEEMLGGAFDPKPFTCRAGTTNKADVLDPRHVESKNKDKDALKQDSVP